MQQQAADLVRQIAGNPELRQQFKDALNCDPKPLHIDIATHVSAFVLESIVGWI